jgi:hypothetical protein
MDINIAQYKIERDSKQIQSITQTRMNNAEKLDAVHYARNRLLSVPLQHRDTEYAKLCTAIEQYLKTNCEHEIIKDLIDIDPDRSKTITYCTKCMVTFS